MADIIPFRFTVTTELHGHVYRNLFQYWQSTCDEINRVFGSAGDFMISTGDVSDSYKKTTPQEFRDVIDEKFGRDFRWATLPGNHDVVNNDGAGIEWIRNEWFGNNPSDLEREATQDYAFPGPAGTNTTQYYFFHKGMMFIVMNWYWDGTTSSTADVDGYFSDTDASGGKIIDEQIDWLRDLFDTYPAYHKIICGHGNAFAFADRHDDYSGLGGATKENRDVFWRMLEDNQVVAYLHGHTHERRIDYVDNDYWNGGAYEDSWSYGTSNVPHICTGQIQPKWPEGWNSFSTFPTFMNVTVTETDVTFDIYEALSVSALAPETWPATADPGWQIILTTTVPFFDENRGGVWYYKQDKFGTEWFNKVDNKKGWTLDFNLRVSDIHNSELLIDDDKKVKGAGIYVNDGTRQETINFLTQEIVFANVNYSVTHDSTVENDYRLIGKGDNLKLFAKLSVSDSYSALADVNFSTIATSSGNAFNPDVFEDVSGNLHSVWWDDGGGKGSIFYSKFEDSIWSEPEEIVFLDNGVQFPSIIVDSSEDIYVVFESKQTEGSVVGLVYKNHLGWSGPYYTGIDVGYCRYPKLTFDSQSNACVVWEDSRQGHPEIYVNTFLRNELKWLDDNRLSTNAYGSRRPSIASYMDEVFVCWTETEEDNTSSIKVIKYNAITFTKSAVTTVSGVSGRADYSDILVNVSGKIFVVWHDDISGTYKIYAAVLTPVFDFLTSAAIIVNGNDGARYPVLSEQLSTGYVYVVWQDFKDSFHDNILVQDIRPSNSTVFVAYYNGATFIASGTGDDDIMLSFKDDRNIYSPSVPVFFRGELPIVYESYMEDTDEYSFISSSDILLRVKHAYYNLSRSSSEFIVNYGSDINDPSFPTIDRDFDLNKAVSNREIRFGDFSNVLSAHYIFKELKYYLDDAVEPHQVKEISANTVDVDSLSVYDAQVSNYGDVWMVGPCGMYYFVDRYNRMIQVGPEGQILGLESIGPDDDGAEAEYEDLKKFRVIAFDKYNNMYIGGEEGAIRYSTNHIKGFKELALTGLTGKTVTSIVFDKDNIMFVGTDSGLYVYDIVVVTNVASDYSGLKQINASVSTTHSGLTDLANYSISSLQMDANNCLWIGTSDNGVYRFYKDNLLHFTTVHGLPSNIINDIAIRNTAVRYVATSSGITKMVGFNFDNTISSKDNSIWNNNVKSVEWKDPNVLLAGTMSRTNQIIINDDDNTYSTVFYEPSSSLNISADDFNVYYLTNSDSIFNTDILEVYINGNLVHFGYDVSSDKKTIRFRSSLSNYDVVEIIVRKDLEEIASFSQTQDEISSVGSKVIRIESLENVGGDQGNLYAVISGDENEVMVNDSNSILPFDRVHLDTAAPRFPGGSDGIKIGDQIDSSIVKVTITDATDDNIDGTIIGSGIEGMVISNYNNFTTDGTIPQLYVPFSTSVNHDLGTTLEDVITELTFMDGGGSVISYISTENELYAATSKPAIVYKYNWLINEWESIYTYDADQYVDFITKYNNMLLIGVGHDTDVARIYVYDYSANGLLLSNRLVVTESRAYCSHELDGKLYIGSGTGAGDEYSGGAGSGGSIYLLGTDPNLTKVVEGIDENVYSMTHVGGSYNLLAATGSEGYIYEVDVENQAAFIIYNGVEDLVSISFLDRADNAMIFVGGDSSGMIRKTLAGSNTYDITFRTTPAKVSVMKLLQVVDPLDPLKNYLTIYAAVGNVIYYLSEAGTWTWKYTHSETVNDITLKESSDALYVISDSGITRVKPIIDSKVIYLKLIDRAGNESVLDPIPVPDPATGTITSPWADNINIANLTDFINENKILEIDELGNTIWTLGDPNGNRYYSADKIEEERGEYVSEIFDGSNDLVKWETISWEAEQFVNTTVSVYIRTSTSRNDILVADWVGPFINSQSAGVDIGSMVGQFIQFKTVLTSTTKGITPSFYRASIRAITSESIHFFTTNFTMPTKINKGIITSQKVVPVSADIVFGINTTDSVDWTEYQPVDENRIFNVNQTGHNLRVGIKLISPNRSLVEPTAYDEYGPYNSNLYVNTIDFDLTNSSGVTRDYHFKIRLYSDSNLTDQVFSAYSVENTDGFSADGIAIPEDGVSIAHGGTSNVLFTVPGSANITCNTFYFVKIEYIYDVDFELFSEDTSFVTSCTSSFIDTIDFNFINNEGSANYYHFRIKFYQDLERTSEYLTVFSGNDRSGWFIDDVQISEDGALVPSEDTVNVVYRPTPTDFSTGNIYYLTIEAHDGTDYVFASNSYTFQVRDIQSTESCGGYMDIPIVRNFSIMFELDNNEFVTLNI